MANVQLLDNKTHRDLLVSDTYSATLGDGLGSAMLVPSEVVAAQREFPLFFRKDPKTGQFFISALLGLKNDENLFATNGEWQSRYIPLSVQRGPFLIGPNGDSHAIYINLEDPRADVAQGQRLFENSGAQSTFAQALGAKLFKLHEGLSQSSLVCKQLSELDLIEPVSLDIVLNSGEPIKLAGLYTINQEKLVALTGETLESVNRSGILALAYNIINSLSNVKLLIEWKNNQT